MATGKQLYLHEELTLLALRDKEGTVAAQGTFDYALAGAMLAELLLRERIKVDEGRRKLVNLASATRPGEPLLDECLSKIADAKRRANLKTWVSRIAKIKKLKHRVALQLVRSNILRASEDKVLGIFTRKIYPELNPKPEKVIIERLRDAIFTETQDVDPRTVVLVSLAHHAKVLKNVFPSKELRGRKKRIKQLVEGEIAGKATKEAIEAMHAAVMVACVVPVVITSGS